MANPQLDAHRRLIHLLTVEGIARMMLSTLLDRVDHYASAIDTDLPAGLVPFDGSLVFVSIASDVDMVTAVSKAAVLLGEVAFRTIRIEPRDAPDRVAALAEAGDILVLHHCASGAAHAVAACAQPGVRVINICDGWHAQPLAALADAAALRRRLPDLHTLCVALVGDLRRDARMRSLIHVLTTLGTPELRLVHTDGPVPEGAMQLGVHASSVAERDLAFCGADVVLTYTLTTPHQPGGMVMHGVPSGQAMGPPVTVPMSAAASLACALAAVVGVMVSP
jgi:aspartate carbamoyltransferase catalytic subunit